MIVIIIKDINKIGKRKKGVRREGIDKLLLEKLKFFLFKEGIISKVFIGQSFDSNLRTRIKE